MATNVLGTELTDCSAEPLTGFYRDGFCNTDHNDHGRHIVCAIMTDEFLEFSKKMGNDLITPVPDYNFPGLKSGDKWCLCALRWKEAFLNNFENKLYNDISNNIFITGNIPSDSEQNNNKLILKNFAIICDGKYREQDMPGGVFDKIEHFSRNNGNAKDGLYHYSFSINNDPYKYQPSGAFNTNKFKVIEFEYNNFFNPPLDLSNVFFTTICDPQTGEPIATTKAPTNIYKYQFKHQHKNLSTF